jgi:long-chain fatty acid transport protein
LRIGAAIGAVVGKLDQKVLPGTSNAAARFFGFRIDSLKAYGANVRLGAQYRISDSVTFGAVYAPKTNLTFKDGSLTANLTSVGLGFVTYRDARIQGLALPQEVDIGFAWQATPKTLWSIKLEWLNWANALGTQTITASNPTSALAAATLQRTTPLNWKDQYVVALGVAHDCTEALRVYAGFNLANNPVPSETLTPLLSPAIAQKHVTAGASYRFAGGWRLSGGALYVFPERVTYTNPSVAFLGTSAEERIEYVGVNAMISREW